MLPIVGSPCQYMLGGNTPQAAVICYVHAPDEVSVVIWSNTGIPSVQQTIPYVAPGNPPPKGGHVIPLPVAGAPSAGTAGS